jgi:5-methylcytosine-specific restriction endonuclease McrA
MRICSGAGCLRTVPDDVRFCDECKPQPKANDGLRVHTLTDRERYHFLYHSRRWWEKTQPQALRRCPFCARCQAAISEIVDHIVPAGIAILQAQESGRWPLDKYAGFWLQSNLQGLCRDCHAKKTAEDKAHVGPWPSVVDAYDAAPKKKWTFV